VTQVCPVKLDLRDRSDEQDFVVIQEKLELSVIRARSENQESVDVMDSLDLVDQWDLEDHPEHLETQVDVEKMAFPEMTDHLVTRVPQDRQENQENPDNLVLAELWELLDQLEPMEIQDQRDSREIVDHEDDQGESEELD